MRNYRKLAVIFSMLSYLFSCVMCGVTAYKYRDLICAAEHKGSSTPPEAAFVCRTVYNSYYFLRICRRQICRTSEKTVNFVLFLFCLLTMVLLNAIIKTDISNLLFNQILRSDIYVNIKKPPQC